jgi:hypothetical protein
VSEKSMSLYIRKMWVRQGKRHWMAEAITFSENGKDVAISTCQETPALAYERLVAGMKELRLVPPQIGTNRLEVRSSPWPLHSISQQAFRTGVGCYQLTTHIALAYALCSENLHKHQYTHVALGSNLPHTIRVRGNLVTNHFAMLS